MPEVKPTKAEETLVAALVEHYQDQANTDTLQRLMHQVRVLLSNNPRLQHHIHSIKWRLKDPTHLRDKLFRKIDEAKKGGKAFGVTKDNLFTKINDLVGFRILHLYTKEVGQIDTALRELLAEELYHLKEGPTAITWDDESRTYFKEIGVKTKKSESMYTSVHYVFEKRSTKRYTFEIQVRTLAEELWGEVDHAINYPHKVDSIACREQIKVLARVTSSCTRLVDSIFSSYRDLAPNPGPAQAERLSRRVRTRTSSRKR